MQTLVADPGSAARKPGSLAIIPIGGRIGAQVEGVDISGEIDPTTAGQLNSALHAYKVLFFRKQFGLTNAAQERFASIFGKLQRHPLIDHVASDSEYTLPFVASEGARANRFHTDISFTDRPFKASVLRALQLPDAGGDTVWANTAVAYANLPAPLRDLAEALWAEHSNAYDYYDYNAISKEAEPGTANPGLARERLLSTESVAVHPVVIVHPQTGERCLLLGAFCTKILGVTADESHALKTIFQNRITSLENTVRWRWADGDVAVWDNMATQHYAVDDYGDRERIMHRVSIMGEQTRSVRGEAGAMKVN